MTLQKSTLTNSPRKLLAPNIPSAAQNTSRPALSVQEAKDLWEHAVLLFKNYDWSEAVVCTQRLLRRSQHIAGFDRAAVWANLGILRMHLGEYYLALEAFERAMKEAGVSTADETDLDDQHTFPYQECPSPASTTLSLFLPSSPSPQPWQQQPPPPRNQRSTSAQAPAEAGSLPLSLLRRTDAALAKHVTTTLSKHFASATDNCGVGIDRTGHKQPSDNRHKRRQQQQQRDPLFPPTTAIFPFLAGLAAYHLPRDAADPASTAAALRAAQRLFRTCLALLPEEVKQVHLAPRGLAWVLERTRVLWNVRICGVEAEVEEGSGQLVAGERWGVNGMPGRVCFECVG